MNTLLTDAWLIPFFAALIFELRATYLDQMLRSKYRLELTRNNLGWIRFQNLNGVLKHTRRPEIRRKILYIRFCKIAFLFLLITGLAMFLANLTFLTN